MEAFTLLKYWRPSDTTSNPRATRNNTITIPTASDEPYFDLEFTPPTDDDDEDDTGEAAGESPEIDEKSSVNTETESARSSAADELPDQETDDEEEEELKFAIKSDKNNVIISPSSIIAEDNSKLPASLLKSATKFRVLLLKLKKTKSSNKSDEKRGSSKLFIEFDVDEVKGSLISLFARDNTTKAKTALLQDSDSKCAASNDERNLTKEMVHKYLKMLKPIRVPGRHAEKMKFSVTGGSSSSTAAAGVSPPELRRSNVVNVNKTPHQKQGGNINTRRKHLGKSRSSSAMVVAPPPSGGMGPNRRRDDSLLQQEDGIRGAILHCKRSFNGTRDGESAVLSRSVSDPSYNI